jgi:methylated-DNA-[protein]-cysteine S-methyltransferase
MTTNGIFYKDEEIWTDYFYADPIKMWVTVEASFNNINSVRFFENIFNNSLSELILPVSSDLLRYFRGETVDFSIYNVDLSGYTLFQQNVLAAVRSIPERTCITYSQLAEMIGEPRAVRAVANALGKNKTPIIIPCHRVVSKIGLGGFSCGVDLKLKLLKLESIPD